jgi:hypothetical protein
MADRIAGFVGLSIAIIMAINFLAITTQWLAIANAVLALLFGWGSIQMIRKSFG